MSSWFDPSGIASLAKNALKEAQKTIDKALDIQEDAEDDDGLIRTAGLKPSPEPTSSSTTTTTAPQSTMTSATQMRQSRSHPALPTAAAHNASAAATAVASVADPAAGISIWGSFTGTFFDTASQQDETHAVTTPPSASTTNTTAPAASGPNRPRSSAKSIDSSVSGSVELVTPPTTPGSSIMSPTSPDTHAAATSSSVGVLADSCVSSSSTSEMPRTVSSTPSEEGGVDIGGERADADDSLSFDDDAHVYIAEPHYLGDDQSLEEEDEEDSRSFNTVAEAQTILPDGDSLSRAGSLHLDLIAATPLSSDAASSAHLSDSTQSFEYVSHTTAPALPLTVAANSQIIGVTSTTTTNTTTAATATATRTISPANSSTASTDERSDIVKISSSGHTSGDDGGETATSSDIEIISSPTTGGDSSSTNSACKVSPSMCQSVAAAAAAAHHQQQQHHSTTTTAGGGLLMTTTAAAASDAAKLGHTRVSSTASDDSALRFCGSSIPPGSVAADELQRLRRHLAEQSEVLEARELRLVDVAREAAELHEQCARLQLALDAKRRRDDCLQVATVTEEFTQRLAALEKKFQLCIRERDALREQLLGARTELAGRVAGDVVERQLRDKDFVIGELQGEGEKLAKQVLQHSNIIKKLRVKERDSDSQHKAEREQIAEQAGELERLKRTLSAKEEVERTQIEAVHRLSGANRKLEREVSQLRGSLEDAEQRVQTLQTSVDAARKEVHVRQAASAQLTRTSEQLGVLEAERVQSDAKREQLLAELVQLRTRVRDAEADTSSREVSLRTENRQLLQRLEELELRLEEQTAAITTATIPLVRQAEALQQTLNGRTALWERQERELSAQLERAQAAVAQMRQAERRAGEVDEQQAKRVQRLEEQLATALLRAEQATSTLQQHIVEAELSETDERRKRAEREALVERLSAELTECRAELDVVGREAQELRQQHKEQQQHHQRTEQEQSRRQVPDEAKTGSNDGEDADRRRSRDNSSPTLSLGRLSLADSLSSHLWQVDDMDCISSAGRSGHLHQLNQPHNASLLEGLQSTLKQRDGENHQLQWELTRQQADRNCMMAEISTLTEQVDDLKERTQANDGAAAELSDVQRKYDALLQMYGEKVEEVQELHLDLDDVKEMYRGQIDELLRQQRASAAVASTSSAGRPAAEPATDEPTTT